MFAHKDTFFFGIALLGIVLLAGCVENFEEAKIMQEIGSICDHEKYSIRQSCVSFLSKEMQSFEGCKNLTIEKDKTTAGRELCFEEVAKKIKDVSRCQTIFDPLYNYSQWECFLGTAIATEDPSLCAQSHKPEFCYQEYLMQTFDPEVCEYMNDKDYCYRWLGPNKNDSTYCEKIENENIKKNCFALSASNLEECTQESGAYNLCVARLAERTKDIRLCEEVLTKEAWNYKDCVGGVAAATKDATVCELIESESEIDRGLVYCYAGVINQTLEEQYCDELVGPSFDPMNCRISIAFEKQAVEVCENITDEAIQKICENALAYVASN